MTTLAVTSPFDGKLIKTIETSNGDGAEKMLATAQALYKNRDGWLEHHERTAILKRMAGLVEAEANDFAMLIAKEGGKPLVDARIEVARAVEGIHLAAKKLSHGMRGAEVPTGRYSRRQESNGIYQLRTHWGCVGGECL